MHKLYFLKNSPDSYCFISILSFSSKFVKHFINTDFLNNNNNHYIHFFRNTLFLINYVFLIFFTNFITFFVKNHFL